MIAGQILDMGVHHATGGLAQRDAAWLHQYMARGGANQPGDHGGPIDAPNYVPAGSVNNLECHDAEGMGLVAPTLVWRA